MFPRLLRSGSAERPVLRAGAVVLTRAELRAAVTRAAGALRETGVGDCSCLLFRPVPSVEFVVRLLAVLDLGAQAVVLDHRLPGEVVTAVGSVVGATHEIRSDRPLPPSRGCVVDRPVTVRRGGAGRRSAASLLQVSSGTTSTPKLCARSDADIDGEIEDYRALGGLAAPGESIVLAASLASAWGVYGGLVTALANDAQLVLCESLTPRGVLGAVEACAGPVRLLSVPSQVLMLSSLAAAPANLHAVYTSGGGLSREEADRIAASASLGGRTAGQVYGMTEVGLIAADLDGATPGSVGRFGPRVRPSVRPDGALWLAREASPYVGHGSADDRWSDGWFDTRDAVRVDDGGTVTVLGRTDGQISLGGKKVYLAEIEAHLRADPSIQDAVVFITGMRLDAFVQVRDEAGYDERRAIGRLPEYMRPHGVHVLPDLPRTPSGKVSRQVARYPGLPQR